MSSVLSLILDSLSGDSGEGDDFDEDDEEVEEEEEDEEDEEEEETERFFLFSCLSEVDDESNSTSYVCNTKHLFFHIEKKP